MNEDQKIGPKKDQQIGRCFVLIIIMMFLMIGAIVWDTNRRESMKQHEPRPATTQGFYWLPNRAIGR